MFVSSVSQPRDENTPAYFSSFAYSVVTDHRHFYRLSFILEHIEYVYIYITFKITIPIS